MCGLWVVSASSPYKTPEYLFFHQRLSLSLWQPMAFENVTWQISGNPVVLAIYSVYCVILLMLLLFRVFKFSFRVVVWIVGFQIKRAWCSGSSCCLQNPSRNLLVKQAMRSSILLFSNNVPLINHHVDSPRAFRMQNLKPSASAQRSSKWWDDNN